MREIKFRGKRIDNGKWVRGGFYRGIMFEKDNPLDNARIKTIILQEGTHYQKEGTYYHVASETVGQFTGLRDKNGVEIYEGDVVLCDRNINDAFNKTTFLIGIDEYFRYQGVNKFGNEISAEEFECAEVIGNIYD